MLPKARQKQLAQLRSRHGRRRSALFVAEGRRVCGEALAACPERVVFATGLEPVLAEVCGNRAAFPCYPVAEREFAALAQTEQPQGILLVMTRPECPLPPRWPDPFVLVLDRIGDPGNLGTILRSAWAVGLNQVAITDGTTDPYGPKAVRAGMGAQFAVAVARAESVAALRSHCREEGIDTVWNTVPDGGVSCFGERFRLPGGMLVLGNEAAGVDGDAAACRVTIPMPGRAESLNVGQAATVLLFEAVRRGWCPDAAGRARRP